MFPMDIGDTGSDCSYCWWHSVVPVLNLHLVLQPLPPFGGWGVGPEGLIILLVLVGLSIHFLYATFFSSNALWHSSSNHPLLSGFGYSPIVCSAASIITSFNCFQSSSIWLFSPVTHSVSNFPNSSSCCWNLLTMLASRNASMWSLLVVLFGLCLLYAILHLYLSLTKKWSESLLAPLHDFTSSMLLVFLLSISILSIWLFIFPSGDLYVCLWISLCRKQVEDTTMFFAAARAIGFFYNQRSVPDTVSDVCNILVWKSNGHNNPISTHRTPYINVYIM